MANLPPKLIFVAITLTMRKIKEKKELPFNEAGQTTTEAFDKEDFTDRLKLENMILHKVLANMKKGNPKK